MAEHKDLTGAQLHEPKGVETADAGTVYVADGAGSGEWVSPIADIYNSNTFTVGTTMTDLSSPSSVYMNIPVKSTMTRMNVLLYGAVDANTVLTIKINGVLFADSLTVLSAGSAAGQKKSLTITTVNTLQAGDIIEIISDGAATASLRADIQLELEAIE
jgi:hypothetical protein